MKELSEKQKALINVPKLKEMLDSKDLESPLPPFNTPEKVKNFSHTQVCMAMDAFLENVINNNIKKMTYKDKDLLFTKTESNSLPRKYPGILNSNESMITLFIKECFLNGAYNKQNLYFNKLIERRGTGQVPLNDVFILFRDMLISNLKTWEINPTRKSSEHFNNYVYGASYGERPSLIYALSTEHFHHKYIIQTFFKNNGALRKPSEIKNKYIDLKTLPLLEEYGVNVSNILDTLYEEYNNESYYTIMNHNIQKYDLFESSKALMNSFLTELPYLYNLNPTEIFESLFLSLPCKYNHNKIKEITPLLVSYINDVLIDLRMIIAPLQRVLVPDEIEQFFRHSNAIIVKYITKFFNDSIKKENDEDDSIKTLPLSWTAEQYFINNPLVITIPDNVQEYLSEQGLQKTQ